MQNKKNIRLILTGGETGGHLYPALAIAEALADLAPGSKSVYVGATGRIDMEKTIGGKYTTHSLNMTPYDRGSLRGNLILPWKFLNSFSQAFRILRHYRPNVVMGVGAYPSIPVILAAWLKRIPTLLLEPNSQPGMANSLLARVTQHICVSQSGMEVFFPRNKIVYTGTPVRNSILHEASDQKYSHTFLGIPTGVRSVLITGGSTGSVTLNSMILENLEFLTDGIGHLIWQTGERDIQRIRMSLGNRLPNNCTILPYIDRMGCAYASADLIVSSAGAVSLSELALLGKPALIIPDPDVTENHQLKNARDLKKKEACILVDKKTSSGQTAALIVELMNDHSKLEQLKHNILQLGEPRAARLIGEQILKVADV